jgi:hypothetical protein
VRVENEQEDIRQKSSRYSLSFLHLFLFYCWRVGWVLISQIWWLVGFTFLLDKVFIIAFLDIGN